MYTRIYSILCLSILQSVRTNVYNTNRFVYDIVVYIHLIIVKNKFFFKYTVHEVLLRYNKFYFYSLKNKKYDRYIFLISLYKVSNCLETFLFTKKGFDVSVYYYLLLSLPVLNYGYLCLLCYYYYDCYHSLS